MATEVEWFASWRAEEHHIEESVTTVIVESLSLGLRSFWNLPLLVVCFDSIVEYAATTIRMSMSEPNSTRRVALQVPSKVHSKTRMIFSKSAPNSGVKR